ncbi:MAG: hypothetical protein KGI54_13520, partial [Pseudomonadota bacterium]|nr:hypothetical protein [Pseudomonadota bacterium]
EKALAGDPVVTRDGQEVKQIAYFPDAKHGYQLIVLVAGWKSPCYYPINGEATSGPLDLFMAPKKTTLWVNLYRLDTGKYWCSLPYEDYTYAKNVAAEPLGGGRGMTYINTYPIEIDEDGADDKS